jgi:hypothetical protein
LSINLSNVIYELGRHLRAWTSVCGIPRWFAGVTRSQPRFPSLTFGHLGSFHGANNTFTVTSISHD